jgi:two-component system cell cycle sensor histidine kinase/response regulator CckA
MTGRTKRCLTLKWMGLLTFFMVLLPIIVGLSIVQIYHTDLMGSFIAVEGIVLIAGILFSFFLARKLILPVEQLSNEIGETGKASWHRTVEPATGCGVKDLAESFDQMIEDLKQSQESLKETEQKYRRIFEKSRDMVFITSIDGKFIDVNQAGIEILGYKSKEELMGMHVKDTYFNHEDRNNFMEEIGKEGFVKDFEVKLKRKDETPIDVLITANARKDDSGILLGYEGIIKDISDRKRVEEELRKSEERYRTIIDNIQEAYYEIDLAGNFTFVNDTTCRDLGYTRDELMGMNNRQYEDETTAKKMFQLYSRVYKTGEPIKILDGEIIRKDGTKKTYEMSVSLIRNLEGKPVGFRGISWDVTERKHAEEALRQSEEKTRQLSQENAIMAEIGRIVSSTLKIEEVYERFAEEVRKLIPFDRVSVNTINPDRASVTIAYTFGIKIRDAQEGTLITMESPFYEDIVSRRSSVLIQTEDESGLAGHYPNFVKHFRARLRSMIATPLISQDQLIGILHIQSLKPNAYTKSDVRLAERVGNQIAGAIANAQLFSERKRAEEALRESEARLQVQISRMPIGCIVWDREFRVLSWNPAAERIFGFTAEEALGRHPYNFIVPKAAQLPVDTVWRRLLDGDSTAHSLNENNTKDGRIIICDWSNTPLKESNGTVIGVLSMVQDITDRKGAEEALRQSEEKYRTIIENIQEAYFENDLAGNFTFFNDALCRHLGYTREELIGMNYRQYADQENAKRLFQAYNRIYRTGEPVEKFDYALIRKDGTKAFDEISVSLMRDSEGKPVGFRGISRDVTERKRAEEALRQSEEKYRTILQSIEDGYYEVDPAGNFTFFNDSMCRILGYPKETLMGMNNRQYTDKEVAKKVFQTFNKVYKTGEPGREFDWEIVRKDGTKRYIEASVSLRKDTSGKRIGFRGIVRDITDRKTIEEQLFQAEKLRAVGEMASGVAHDFNNALAAILGNTQLLLYTAQDGELKETLRIIEKVAKDSSQTVRRLQDFTRRRVPQELFRVDLNSIIKDSIEITKPRWKDEAQSKGIRIEMVSNLEDIPFVSGSASELREVFANMIFNAVEAMREGGKIEIRTFKKRRDIYIQISDTGAGIAEEARKRIFEPFFTTKPFTNTGLGLSMSYGIVKRFGGEIEAESNVGQGTTFTITLPIGEEEKEETVDPQLIKKGRKARILVIDDEEFVRSVLCRSLAQADHQVALAEDGIKGVQSFKEGNFDIVLTDLGMPGMSGWEVCRIVKEISPRTPVGMITGWGEERSRNKMEEYGLDFFIPKPFDFAQILNVVAEIMESKKE